MYLCLTISIVYFAYLFTNITSNPVSSEKHHFISFKKLTTAITPSSSLVTESNFPKYISTIEQITVNTSPKASTSPKTTRIPKTIVNKKKSKRRLASLISKPQQSQLRPFFYSDDDNNNDNPSASTSNYFNSKNDYFKPKRFYDSQHDSHYHGKDDGYDGYDDDDEFILSKQKNRYSSHYLFGNGDDDDNFSKQDTLLPHDDSIAPFKQKLSNSNQNYHLPHSHQFDMSFDYNDLFRDVEIGLLMDHIDLDSISFSGHYQPKIAYDDSLPMDGHFDLISEKKRARKSKYNKKLIKPLNTGCYGSSPNFVPIHDYPETYVPDEITSESFNLGNKFLVYGIMKKNLSKE